MKAKLSESHGDTEQSYSVCLGTKVYLANMHEYTPSFHRYNMACGLNNESWKCS